VGGARILGTSDALLELRPEVSAPPTFQVVQGRLFTDDFEAVLGSRAAAQLGLGIGDQFLGAHGIERGLASDTHEQPYTVVGIFAQTDSPYDSAVFVNVNTVWRAHELTASDPMNAFAAGGAALDSQLTALLVKPSGFVEANLLWQEFASGQVAQAAFPGQELGALFDLFRLAENVLTAVGYLVLGMGALTVFLSMYSAIAAREQAIAVMRSVGGGRATIFRMVMFETLAIVLIGALLGRLLGYGAAFVIANVLSAQTAIPLPLSYLVQLEPALWAMTLLVGVGAGLLPAIRAYSVNAVDKLFAA